MVKSGGEFTFSHLANQRFLFFFGSSVALHAVWDMEVPFVSNVYIKLAILDYACMARNFDVDERWIKGNNNH